MKRISIYLLLFGMFFGIKAQNNGASFKTEAVTDLVDSSYYWQWDTIINIWNLKSKQINTYDANENQTVWLFQKWDGNIWINNSHNLFSY